MSNNEVYKRTRRDMNENYQKNARLTFNIGGQRHEAFLSTLRAVPGSRLHWISENLHLIRHSSEFDEDKNELFFDRNPVCFVSILNYFRTGKLHYPTCVCGPTFECELRFWGIDEKQLESCCWEGYTADRDKNDKLQGFKGPLFRDEGDREVVNGANYNEMQMKMWLLIDEPFSSLPAKVSNHSVLSKCL